MAGAVVLVIFSSEVSFPKTIGWSPGIWYDGPIILGDLTERTIEKITMMMRDRMILVIDNYDSYTYNLVQYLRQLDETVVVKRNDKITI